MIERKIQLLERIQEKLKEWEITSLYRKSEEENLPMDILTVLINDFGNGMDEVMGEFFFMPKVEGRVEDALCFHCVLTLTDAMIQETLPDIYEVISTLNYVTETGHFAISRAGGMLVYRNTLAMPLEVPDETDLELIMANIAFSLNEAEKFVDVIARVRDGRMSIEEFRGLFPV